MKVRESIGRKTFYLLNICFLMAITVITLYPIMYVIFASFSIPGELMAHRGLLYRPLGFYTEGYSLLFKNPMVISGYMNTGFVVIVGVALNIVLTSMGAYFLSRKGVLLRNAIMFFIVFTMYFSGGLIPFYLTVKELGIDDSPWALILPVAVNTFNLIIMRTAFLAVPDSMEESARIDGATHFRILFRIFIPLTLPTIAVMVLYYGVGHWNAWFNALVFLRKRELYPLQLVLREIVIQNNGMEIGVDSGDRKAVGEVMKYAVIVFATVPILALYPFLQKYFVKGVMVGALKE